MVDNKETPAISTLKIPWFLLFLDGLGVILVVAGFLTTQGFDFGLPVLAKIWPFLILLGLGLMAPMVVWIVQLALQKRNERQR